MKYGFLLMRILGIILNNFNKKKINSKHQLINPTHDIRNSLYLELLIIVFIVILSITPQHIRLVSINRDVQRNIPSF